MRCLVASRVHYQRFSRYAQNAPAFFVMCSSVTGIVTSILKQRYYLMPIHGVGAMSSVYLFSLSSRLAITKTIGQRAEELEKTNQGLQKTKDALEATNTALQSTATSLETTNQGMSTQVSKLQASIETYQKSNEELNTSLLNFTQERERLAAAVTQLEKFIPQREEADNMRVASLCERAAQMLDTVLKGACGKSVQEQQAHALVLQGHILALETTVSQLRNEVSHMQTEVSQMRHEREALVAVRTQVTANVAQMTELLANAQKAKEHPTDSKPE